MDSGVNRTFVTAPGYWKFESTFLQQRVNKLSVPKCVIRVFPRLTARGSQYTETTAPGAIGQ